MPIRWDTAEISGNVKISISFVDWIMDLPEAHERLFWMELAKLEEDEEMTYVTSVERIGIKKGMQQGTM